MHFTSSSEDFKKDEVVQDFFSFKYGVNNLEINVKLVLIDILLHIEHNKTLSGQNPL